MTAGAERSPVSPGRHEVPALVQVNLAGEESKGGVDPQEIQAYLSYDVRGLSTMPPAAMRSGDLL